MIPDPLSPPGFMQDQGSDGERAFETHLRQLRYPEWVREHRFDAVRKWRFDFAWPDLKVAVEIEGGTWSNGRHGRGHGFEGDCLKYDEAAIAGWLVLRVTTDMVNDGRAIQLTGRALWAASLWKR